MAAPSFLAATAAARRRQQESRAMKPQKGLRAAVHPLVMPRPPTRIGSYQPLGLRGPVHRRQRLRARATAGSCCWGQAGHRAHLTRPQRPRRDEEHLLGARQRRGTSSPSPSSRTERSQLVLRRVHGCSPPVCKRRKRRTASEGQPNPAQSTWASSGQGPAAASWGVRGSHARAHGGHGGDGADESQL